MSFRLFAVRFSLDFLHYQQIMGIKVKSFENNRTVDKKFNGSLNIGTMNKGIYYVNITTAEGEILQEKLIID